MSFDPNQKKRRMDEITAERQRAMFGSGEEDIMCSECGEIEPEDGLTTCLVCAVNLALASIAPTPTHCAVCGKRPVGGGSLTMCPVCAADSDEDGA